jgi:hypothetical protein
MQEYSLLRVLGSTMRMKVKDRLQEVKDTLLLPGNTCLHLKGISTLRQCTKNAIKPNPHLDPWDHWFLGPPAFPTMQSFSSLLYK